MCSTTGDENLTPVVVGAGREGRVVLAGATGAGAACVVAAGVPDAGRDDCPGAPCDGDGGVSGFLVDFTAAHDALLAERVNAELMLALESHAAIDQAKGILMLTYGVDEDAAFGILKQSSQRHNVRLRERARDMGWSLSVMIPAMNVDDRTEMLGGMRSEAPAEVFAGVWALVTTVLAAADVAAVAAAVLDRPQTAGHTINFEGGRTPIRKVLEALA